MSSPVSAAQVFRLSPPQRRVWALAGAGHAGDAGDAAGIGAYRALVRVRLDGRLDLRALEAALADVAARHEILRTTFPVPEGMNVPGQAVHDEPAPLRLAVREGTAAETLWEELAARPFRPDREPPLAAALAALEPGRHVLVLAVHALCADEASLGVLVRDLRRAYAARAAGRIDQEEPPVQYADVAAALDELLESEESEAGRAWWREILPAAPSLEDLPFERGAGPLPFDPRWVEAPLDPAVASPAVLLAAWQALLARLSGGTQQVTGYELAGRHYEGFETAVGPFSRSVPIQAAVRPGERFADLVARLDEEIAVVQDWQDYFAWERDDAFFPTIFRYTPEEADADAGDAAAGVLFSLQRAWACTDRFRLRLTVRGGVAELSYDAARFRERDARTLLASWLALLASATAAPHLPVGELELVGAEDRRRLLDGWNATERPFEPVPVQDLFFAQARRTPEAVALSSVAGEALTYRELAERVESLAGSLQRAGVGPDVPVALYVEASVEMVVGVLAILTAGGAYVPLDPSYPPARLALVLEASGAPVILTRKAWTDRLPGRTTARVVAVEDWGTSGEEGAVAPSPAERGRVGEGAFLLPETAAYILFTSGSTGTPKGVVVRHRALTNHMLWMQDAYPLAADDKVLQKTPLGFDASVWEVLAPLLAGARLVIAEPETYRDPARLARVLAETGGTVLQVVPSLLRLLLAEESFAAGSALRRLYCGGEPLSAPLRERVHALLPGADLINLYGPTETTVQVVTWLAERDDTAAALPGESVPIGRPIHNARIYLLDPGMRLVPPGLPGELWIGGEPPSRGYLGRPDLTAAGFLPDPFSREPGARLYRSGDLARYRDDGALVFLGRAGREVKIRGYRFDPGEIEDLLGREPGVREAAVVVRDDRLVAYVAPGAADPSVLRAHLAEHLPSFLVPSAFVPLPALPRTPSGKLDRAALPDPAAEAARPALAGAAAPRTAAEQVLAEIWADLLGRERVGVHDDFFELGGHSLLGAQLVARVRQALGVELSLRTVFETPTVAGLAAQVAAAWDVPVAPPVERVPRDGGETEIPLSFAQQRLWFVDRLAPGHPAYNGFSAARFTGRLDERALVAALREIVRVQESLRTTFPAVEGRPVQRPLPDFAPDLPVADLTGLPEERRLPEALRLAGEAARRPFDLAAGPLLRLTLLRLGEDDSILCTALHHIVSDAWSIGILYRDLMALYAAAAAGRPAALPEPPVQYIDYAVWQRRWFEQVRERELAWWRERLADLPTLRLPADHPRPSGDAQPSAAGITLPAALPADLSERLRRLARAESVTPFMLLLAAFQALLARWSGQDEVVVGVPVANRERAEVEGLVGFFVNTLVLPTSCAGDPTGRELLGRVREVALGAFAHQAMPFEVLVEELAPERDGLQPLFQVMFQLQTVPVPRFTLPGAAVEVLDLDLGASPFDLVLDLRETPETPEGVAGVLQASADLFDPATLVRLLGHFRALLEGLAADPRQRVAELPLLSPAERHQIAIEWNDTERPYERDRCIHELVAEQAARTPDAEALSFADGRLTYTELEARSNRLARHLLLRGAGPEAKVALRMESSAGFFVALLAILKTGAAYLPLDPTWPDSRVDLLLEEAGAALLLTAPDLEADAIACQSPAPLPPRAFPESLAYVVFTSGSTGRPKGVAVPHRAVVRMARSAEAVPIAAEDRVAQVSNVSFDGLVYEIWGALLHGACLVGLPREVLLDLRALAGYLRRERISFFLSTAALLHQAAREEPTTFQLVRRLSSGGEAFDARAARELLRAGGMGELFNDYGPTETTCFILVEKVTAVAAGARVVPIGRPIGNTVAAVLDRRLAPVPIGAPGELCLGGEGLARGYLGQPALTAERFVPDPVGPVATAIPGTWGTRLYRTGDRVRLLPDGRVDFLGRFDDQVKVRGFRIEPGEIEGALAAHPQVAAAVVLPREEEGSRALVAYVVPTAGAPEDLDTMALRAFLRQRLPEFLVPAWFVALPALPVNPNGKVDRKALSRIAPERQAASGSRPPRGALEETIAAVWAEALGTHGSGGIGARDGFFDLGGHSLLALRVLARMRDVLGLDVPLRVLFEAPTVEGLAAWIAAERGNSATAAAPPVVPVPRQRPLPLSFTQERLWLVDRLYPGTPLYNVPAVLRLRGTLAVPALAAALTEIVRRHEVLRTRYATREDGTPVQTVEPASEIAVPLADLSALPEEPRLAEAGRLAWEESVRPFDLRAAPVLRALLLRLGEGDHTAALTTHHIASDGWSQNLFVREVGVLYGAFAAGRPSPLSPLPVQYADFAVWQRHHLRDDLLADQLAWWRERLAGAPPVLELPADRPRPRLQSFAGEVRAATWAPPFVESLRGLARREGGTLFLVLLAAFESLVVRLTGREDVIVGSPIANRPRPELEELIGFFANTLVLRTDLSGDPPFREAVARVRETSLGAWERQDLPFERLVEELRPQRDLSHPPIFQVMFVHHGNVTAAAGLGNPEIPGLEVEPFGGSRAVSRYDLEVYALESAEGLFLAFEYSTALFDAGRMVRLLGQMETLLRGALDDPGRRLSDLPLLTEEETREVLAGWSTVPELSAGEGALLHDLVEEQAGRTPDAVALIAGEESWTYRELDRRAEEIAADLRRRGVGWEDRVAVSLPRRAEMIAAMLGVLKAGAAYVPVDPALPAARRARILEDAAAVWVIGSEALSERTQGGGASPRIQPPPSQGGGTPAPNSLAYLLYTSGSTGTPKGVAVPHSAAVALVRWAGTVFSRSDLAGVLAATSTGFDVSVFEIFAPLAHGGTVILAENVLELPRLPAAGAVTLVCAVPTAMAELLRSGGLPGGVRVVNLGGEAVPRELADPVLAEPGVERVYNCYGPTEDTTYSTVSELPRAELPGRDCRPPSIGRPILGGRAVVVDRWLRPAPVGVPGELCLAGAGLARGYLGRPAETAERWIPEPFSGKVGGGGERMYRTGDLVRRRADGELEYLGRIDHQVKVRGFRIEPGEVEAALRAFPGAGDAVVDVREEGGERRLVAWVTGPALEALAPAELRRFLRERLPEPLVPSFFVALPDFPRTATGKVDRKALPAPAWAPVEEGRAATGGPVEELVASVWAEVLGVERVGLHDSFFDLGGHSLLATRLVARLGALFGVELPVRTVFAAPTVAAFARALLAAERGTAPPLVRRSRPGDPPVSFTQERMWFLDRLVPGAYHIPLAFRLTGELDVGALEGALRALIQRHEPLRTTFRAAEDGPVQRIGPAPALSLPRADLSGLPGLLRQREQERLGIHLEMEPFDLEAGPLLRVLLLRTGPSGAAEPGEHVLLLTLHHIISDGWSLGVLLRELAVLYQSLRDGVPAGLPELPVQYADWAAWQREWLRSGALEAGLAWWVEHLGGPPAALRLPGDRPRPATRSFRASGHQELLPPGLLGPVRALARQSGASLFMVLLAAWEAFLARHAGQDDFGVGTPVAGRDHAEVEGLIGLFVNTLALRARVPGEESFAALLARVRESTLGAFAHAWVPFERVVEAVQPRRDLVPGHSPLFQTMLVLQSAPQAAVSLPDLDLAAVDGAVRTVPYDLVLVLVPEEGDGALVASWQGARDLFDVPTVVRFAARFRSLLAAAAADPERAVNDLTLLTGPERQALLCEWNDSAAPLGGETVHGVFAARVEHRPQALAVEAEGEFLTYEELDRRARRLAWRLRGLGVRPDAPVGLCADSVVDLTVGMLATLQAGGACLPLDPEYPLDRLDFLLRDARPRAVLTRKHLARRLPETGAAVLLLEEALEDPDTGRDPGPLPPPAALGDHLASVFYTSGSTGRPKGAGISHRAVCRLILDPRWPIGTQDRVAQLSSPSFDASTLEIWGALLRGACLVGLRRAEILAPRALAAAVREHGLTALVMPAAWFHRVAAEAPDAFAPLTFLSVGGEAADPTAVARVLTAGPPRWLFHGYGPTEVTTLTTAHTVREVAAGLPNLPAGRPLAGVSVYVLDRHLRLAPLGVHGDLYAGGDRLARGYLRQPALTAERFIPDPFGPPGGRLYATGDLARVLPRGEIEILGRRDCQVKVRGYRIEPGEIEAVLTEHPGVAQAAVVVREQAGEKRLAAFVVPRGEAGDESAGELRAFLAERLPSFMLPADLVLRAGLPATAHGKVDREALARLPVEAPAATGDAAPLTLTEELLAGIWSGVLGDLGGLGGLGGRRPQPHDSFFDLGGHSLLATRLLARIRDAFGVELPLVAVFEAPTLALMAAKLEELVSAGTAETAADAPWSPLVRLAAGPDGATPLVCVHGAAGTIAVFAELARLLRGERPVYALQSRGLIAGQAPPGGIEESAELYLAALREARPHGGPCRLLGYSMGAQIAYEMACRLAAAGETVELLVLVDFPAVAPGIPKTEPPPLPEVVDLRGLDDETVRRYRAVWLANHNAAYAWRPAPYAGKTLLIRAAEASGPPSPDLAADPALGWNAVVAGGACGVDIAVLPGDHFTLFSLPFVSAVAAALRNPVPSEET